MQRSFRVYDNAGMAVSVCTRPRSLCIAQASVPVRTHEDYRREVTEDLFHACLNARLSKTAMRDRPPFLTASSRRVSVPCTVCSMQYQGVFMHSDGRFGGRGEGEGRRGNMLM